MNTLEVGSALDVACEIAERLPETLSQTAKELYRVLVHAGIEVERRRGHAPSVTETVMHLPVELVAEVAGVSRTSAWRHLPQLVELGLVSHRAHKASCRYGERLETRNSGTVWRVRLSPLRGSKARVSADDMRHKWRGREMRGAASRRILKRTKDIQDRLVKIEMLIQWALSPASINPVQLYVSAPAQTRLEALLDVVAAGRDSKREIVCMAAQALSQALRDASSLNYYRKLCWRLTRHHDATGQDYSYQVYLMAQRARTDALEGFARRPGALFVSRMMGASWFAEMMAGPPVRVGTKPMLA